jgi:hypothetical protein
MEKTADAKEHIVFKEINISQHTYIRTKKKGRGKKKQKTRDIVVEYE